MNFWERTKQVLVFVGAAISIGSLAVGACTYYRTGAIEEDRWRAHLAVQPAWEDVDIPGGMFRAPSTPGDHVLHWVVDLPAGLPDAPVELRTGEIRVRVLPEAGGVSEAGLCVAAATMGEADVRNLRFLLRNSSFRPAAIVKVLLRDKSGVEVGPRTHMKLPVEVDPWRIITFSVPIAPGADKVLLRDMDDRELSIPLTGQRVGGKWFEFR